MIWWPASSMRTTLVASLIRCGERIEAFALTLHSDRLRLIEFGRYAATNRKIRGFGKPAACASRVALDAVKTNRHGFGEVPTISGKG